MAHRLQTSKMRRNSNSLDSCQYDNINIVTVSVARRRWTAPLKSRRPCVKHFTTFYALLKHVSPKGDYFTPKGHFLRPRAIILRTGARRDRFAVYKRCANQGFACMCKENEITEPTHRYEKVPQSWGVLKKVSCVDIFPYLRLVLKTFPSP